VVEQVQRHILKLIFHICEWVIIVMLHPLLLSKSLLYMESTSFCRINVWLKTIKHYMMKRYLYM
jgi:uracil DNA glycosylase